MRLTNSAAAFALLAAFPATAVAQATPECQSAGAQSGAGCRFAWQRAESYRLPQPENYGVLTRRALRFSELISQTVKKAKQPGFTQKDWAPLAELVATDKFERVGAFREKMDWRGYTEFLTKWASATEFSKILRGVTEVPNRVFVELEEHNTSNGKPSVVNSVSIYDFDENGKIKHLDIYLQRNP